MSCFVQVAISQNELKLLGRVKKWIKSSVMEMDIIESFVHIMWTKWKDAFLVIGNFHYSIIV